MSDLVTSEVFNDGEDFTAARINNAFATAAIQIGFVTGKSAITPVAADYLLFFDLSGNVLAKCLVSTFATALQGNSASTLAAGNDTRFPATVTGLRKGNGASPDAAAAPPDLAFAPEALTLTAGAVTGNCALKNRFTLTLTANATVTLTNIPDGGEVILQTTQDATGGRTLTFVTTGLTQTDPGGTAAVSAAANAVDIWRMVRMGDQLRIMQFAAFS